MDKFYLESVAAKMVVLKDVLFKEWYQRETIWFLLYYIKLWVISIWYINQKGLI